jgi:hypothetical protein
LGHTRSEIDLQRLGERQWQQLRRVVRQAIRADARGGAEQELEPTLAQVDRGSPVRTKIRRRETNLRRRSPMDTPGPSRR